MSRWKWFQRSDGTMDAGTFVGAATAYPHQRGAYGPPADEQPARPVMRPPLLSAGTEVRAPGIRAAMNAARHRR
jgi:hypothetical protein